MPVTDSNALDGQPRSATRVLVVDDDEGNATMLTRLLELCGHHVRAAGDGPTAIATACDFQPRVVLLDIGLPGMDGFEVARRLREALAAGSTLLVAVSGYERFDFPASRQALFDHFLVKPARLEDIQKLIRLADGSD